MRWRLTRWWRKLRGRCQMCGERPPAVAKAGDTHSMGPHCRICNKRLAFAQLYGMGPKTFNRIVAQKRQ
jgi:hypothetical protein